MDIQAEMEKQREMALQRQTEMQNQMQNQSFGSGGASDSTALPAIIVLVILVVVVVGFAWWVWVFVAWAKQMKRYGDIDNISLIGTISILLNVFSGPLIPTILYLVLRHKEKKPSPMKRRSPKKTVEEVGEEER